MTTGHFDLVSVPMADEQVGGIIIFIERRNIHAEQSVV
jgi:hypothetical protein